MRAGQGSLVRARVLLACASALVTAALMLVAATTGFAASPPSGCNEYYPSCGGTSPGPGSGPGTSPGAPSSSAATPVGAAPTAVSPDPVSSSRGHAPIISIPSVRPKLAAGGHLPFTGYPLTPLVEVLLAMLVAAILLRAGIEIRQARAKAAGR